MAVYVYPRDRTMPGALKVDQSSMFYADHLPVPEQHDASDFTFRPLRTSDADLDYGAVMSSSTMLRAWRQTGWPREGFTLAENLEDLKVHEREHLEKAAFTYTIMNPGEAVCLGCIYLEPLSREIIGLGACEPRAGTGDFFAASLRYWVRESHLPRGLNLLVLEELERWLEEAWYFDCVLFPVAVDETAQSALFEARGYEYAGEYTRAQEGTRWRVYRKQIR